MSSRPQRASGNSSANQRQKPWGPGRHSQSRAKPGATAQRARLGVPWGLVRSLLILLAVGGLVSAGWLGVQLIMNPQALLWINRYLPNWIPFPVTGLKSPQTLSQIRTELLQAGQRIGEPLPLGTNISFLDAKTQVSDLVLPILAPAPNCQENCDRIVELRLYQSMPNPRKRASQEPYFQLVNQLPIVGPDEAFVVAPVVDARSPNQGSTRSLSLTTLSRFEGKVPSGGSWLNLSGQLVWGDTTIAYGRVIHYNPKRFHLGGLLDWTSSVNKAPVWQEITGQGSPELLIDQTFGLEPRFKLYRVAAIDFQPDPIRLEAISLFESALDLPTYETALLLARSGLWSTSVQWLQSIKRRSGRQWSAAAQAQMDLIQWHAIATRAQAEKTWASPSQQVLANLIDGRWIRALQTFTASSDASHETALLLKESSRLQNRIEAALRVNPTQFEVKAWKALLIAAQQNRASAIAWWKQAKSTPADLKRIQSLLARLEAPNPDAETALSSPPGQLVGSVSLLSRLNPAEWQKPSQSPALKLGEQQAWYVVQMAGFQDGQNWRFTPLRLPASMSANALWKQVGLLADPPLQLVFWLPDGQQQTVSASIKAVRFGGGGVQLLAAGDAIAPAKSLRPRPLAFTESALQWLTPSSSSLGDLVQQQPAWASKAVPALVGELKQASLSPTEATWESLTQLGAADWLVQPVSFTRSPQPDWMVSLYPPHPAKATSGNSVAHPRTLIFSSAGTLLYSELSTDADRTVLAIADLGDGTPTLVADGPQNYQFLRWSTRHRRFE